MSQRGAPDPEIMSPEDKRFIETIDAEYRPPVMDAGEQAAFRRRLDGRLERGRYAWRLPTLALAASAVVALLWFTRPQGGQPDGARATADNQAVTPVLYAFVDPSDYAGDRLQPKDFLPDDYLALADALEVPVDNP